MSGTGEFTPEDFEKKPFGKLLKALPRGYRLHMAVYDGRVRFGPALTCAQGLAYWQHKVLKVIVKKRDVYAVVTALNMGRYYRIPGYEQW